MDTEVLHRFVDASGRITTIPARHAKRLQFLDWLAQDFAPWTRFSELEVNRILLRRHRDYCALRRYLVEMGFLGRDNNVYWRVGGTGMEIDA